MIGLVETMLGLPTMGDYAGWLAPLSLLELDTHSGSVPVVPGGLNEHMTAGATPIARHSAQSTTTSYGEC